MRTNHQLRLYANPIRLLLFLLPCAALAVISVWLLRLSSDLPGDGIVVFIWVFALGFLGSSGLGIAATLPQLVWAGILRHPTLQIDEQGWSSFSPFLLQAIS